MIGGVSRRAALVGLWILFSAISCGQHPAQATLRFDQARFWLGNDLSDPPVPPHWGPEIDTRTVTLPDRFGRRVARASGIGWYHVPLGSPQLAGICGILILHVHPNAVLYLNGEWLGQAGRFIAPEAHTWNRPLYFPFACSRLLKSGINWLDIGVQANKSVFNALGVVTLGKDVTVRPHYERAFTLRTRLAEAGSIIGVIVAALFVTLGLALRQAPYLLMALCAACYSLNSLNFHWLNPPLEYWRFDALVNLAVVWMSCAFVATVLSVLGLRVKRVEQSLLAFAAAVLGLSLVLAGEDFERLTLLTYIPCVLMCSSALLALVVYRSRLPTMERSIYLTTSAFIVTISGHDLYVHVAKQLGTIDIEVPHWLPYLGPTIMLGFGAGLLARFLQVYRLAERANLELKVQVARKHKELEASFQKLRAMEKEKIVGEERERIMREMHDGLGGHLVSTLVMVERGETRASEISAALRAALDDMRLVFQSLQPQSPDISGLLADLRLRLEPKLASVGLRFQWAVGDVPPIRLNPTQILHVLRVVQESITNVLKHARAQCVKVATGVMTEYPPRVVIEVSDDGQGMCGSLPGRGTANMRERAQLIGADLLIDSGPDGTRIRLCIPVEQRS